MRSATAKKLRKLFEERLKENYSQFQVIKRGAPIPPGWRLYEWKMDDGFSAYLLLCISPKAYDDRFTLEVAWSRKSRFPIDLIPMNPVDVPEREIWRDLPKEGEFLTRIGLFFPPYHDYWWNVADGPDVLEMSTDQILEFCIEGDQMQPNERLIAERVEDAITRIRDYVVPYLESARRSD